MKKFIFSVWLGLILIAVPAMAATTKPAVKATAKPVVTKAVSWKPIAPEGYSQINWAKAPGIVSYFKAPSGNGSLDFITRINLAQNQVQFIATSSAPLDYGFATDTVSDSSTWHNYAFERFVAEASKYANSAQFIWNGPFFNATVQTSDLSMALKTVVGTTTIISSGSRPASDMAAPRRMLLINNRTGKAAIQDFDADIFVTSTSGDQGLEGFAPTVPKMDSASGAAARLFLGVSSNGKELIIYCSQAATVSEASDALTLAGAMPSSQLEADGGGSAACGYNLPGQYFVEPNRTLPVLMGAATILARGTANTEGVNVRSGPGTKNSIVTKLSKNTAVRVIAEKNGWYKIGDGQWVLKSLIKKS